MFKSIRSKFLFVYILLFTITITALSAMFMYSTTRQFNELTTDQAMENTRSFAKEMGDRLLFHRVILQGMAIEDGVQAFDKEAVDEIIKHYLNADGIFFENIFLIDTKGRALAYAKGYERVREIAFYKHVAPDTPDYYIGDPIWDLLLRQPVVQISVAVKDKEGELIGVVEASVPLKRLSKELENTKLISDSFGWIVDREGMIIAHPDVAFETYTNIKDLPRNDELGNAKNFEDILTWDEGTGYYWHSETGVKRGYTFATVKHTPGWKLGITFVEQDMFHQSAGLGDLLAISAGLALVIAIGVTIYLTTSIVKPIQELTASTQNEQAFEGQLSLLQENEEIKTLIAAYNKMRARIQLHTEELENLVEERTMELNKANEALYKQATVDRLTGILNRGQLNVEANKLMEEVKTGAMGAFGILFMDLDNFKYYNDSFGHDIGDKILIDVVKRFISVTSAEDILIRYGGDEFIILLPAIDEETVKKVIRRIQQSMDQTDSYRKQIGQWLALPDGIDEIQESKKLSISIGYAIYYGREDQSLEDLLKKADKDMYDKKQK
ncbi:sensor domain-containing diguanylate cyclase [Acidaminobacter sp. JC074]|uniref:sensor domain-containing diguanylate cyclase n=1 Tax=Acidaminobacter sp. JC074 TaxID=2530199 RepID=UPI001F10F406|nr:sensor domain-containing diguanylate cyclase [Acidaminobacter sp. JC074]